MGILDKLLGKQKPVPKNPASIKFTPYTVEWYIELWETMKFDDGYEPGIQKVCEHIIENRPYYERVQAATNVPWYVVAGIHYMEASLNFKCVLHNGEKIIGTGKKTRLVPGGRGPFNTWEEAAIDALQYDGFVGRSNWPIGIILRRCEEYNGLGYIKHHPGELTPYLWAQTNHNDGYGKYVEDGKWSDTAPTNARPGIAAILKKLQMMGVITI